MIIYLFEFYNQKYIFKILFNYIRLITYLNFHFLEYIFLLFILIILLIDFIIQFTKFITIL